MCLSGLLVILLDRMIAQQDSYFSHDQALVDGEEDRGVHDEGTVPCAR